MALPLNFCYGFAPQLLLWLRPQLLLWLRPPTFAMASPPTFAMASPPTFAMASPPDVRRRLCLAAALAFELGCAPGSGSALLLPPD